MRKPRDFDAEIEALDQKTRTLRQRKIMQLGELVIACRADALPIDMLAGALLAAASSKDASTKEAWRKAGAAMFQRKAEQDNTRTNASTAAASDSRTQPAGSQSRQN
ncbi:conjugal transfer protein TraD [Sphingomonas sp. RT2P30]|uniref:conjugal transfer protein TraD n=1 Tax=Parasphingomonas halimpatiens TaxID=3096162 RepID=UPI002FCA4313